MGYVIVMIVGAILGWLTAIIVDRDDQLNTALCASAGIIGAVITALVAGSVPLAEGVSAPQLLWSVGGAILAIIPANALLLHRPGPAAKQFNNPAGQRQHRSVI